ncbi:MAG TPA: Na-translocating system protein MpsC family protein [Vicinamibacterales bacterium]|nr:Na-translocating system protein MpsC family protein [Vicinamibacterales bacterium]
MADQSHLPRLETAPGLEVSGAGVAETPVRNDSLLGRISHAMVGMKKDFYGKGPTKAKTFINDEYVFVVMEGGLTRNEEVLLAAGQHELVRAYRLRFQEAMTNTTIAAVEEILGRKVLTYHSQILFDPERAIEIFVLDSPGR